MTLLRSDMLENIPTRQFWIREPGVAEIREAVVSGPAEGEVLVETLYTALSRGTEALVFEGRVPPSQYHDMRAPFQEGDFPGPVKYGYINVGRVVAAPDPQDDHLLGRVVFCLFPHQDRYVVPAAAVTPLPPGVPPDRAVLGANLETAVNVVWDAGVSVGDRVAVIGGGVVGMLVAWLCARIPGTRTVVVDVNAARAVTADALGLPFLTAPPPDADADVVIHASGTAAGLRSALAAAGMEATVVEASWHGDRDVALPLGEAFHARRLTLRSSQVGRIPPGRAPRWSHGRRMATVLDLLADDTLDALVTAESDFEALPAVASRLAREPGDALCHRIRYPAADEDGGSR